MGTGVARRMQAMIYAGCGMWGGMGKMVGRGGGYMRAFGMEEGEAALHRHVHLVCLARGEVEEKVSR